MSEGTRDSAFPGPREDPAERTFLGGFSLGARYGWLALFAGLAAAIAGGILFLADQRVGQVLTGLSSSGAVAREVARIENATSALRSDTRRYLDNHDAAAADSYRKDADALGAALRELIDDPAANDAQKLATTVNDGLTQHSEQFQNIVRIVALLGSPPNQGLIGNTLSAGNALEKRVAESGNTTLVSRLASLRRIETAIATGTAAPADKSISDEVDDFRRVAADSTLGAVTKADIDKLSDAYGADLGQLARIRTTLNGAISRLDEINTYIAPNLDSLGTFANEYAQGNRRIGADVRDQMRVLVLGGVALAILVLFLAAVALMRSVTHPMLRLARAAAELAHGNQVVAIPVLGNDDASGALARALTYFRESLVQADRLRKELEVHLKRADDAVAARMVAETAAEEARARAAEQPAIAAAPPPAAVEPEPEPEAARGRALVPATANEGGGSQIAGISRALAESSRLASDAAGEAERTELMVHGLSDAMQRLDDIESLLASISDQMSLLAVQTALAGDDIDNGRENLVLLAEKRQADGGHRGAGQSVSDRIETIQNGLKRAVKTTQAIGRSISDVNDIAIQFAADASGEALDAATALLQQSESLRGLLDDLLNKIRAEGGALNERPRGRMERD